jgi:hypothetical protein
VALLLVLLLVPAVWVKLMLRKSSGEMVLPYLAFAVPCIAVAVVAPLLRTWEGRGASPRTLAVAWSLCMTILLFGVFASTFYSAAELRLMDRGDAVGVLFMACMGGAFAGRSHATAAC